MQEFLVFLTNCWNEQQFTGLSDRVFVVVPRLECTELPMLNSYVTYVKHAASQRSLSPY